MHGERKNGKKIIGGGSGEMIGGNFVKEGENKQAKK